MTTDEFENDRYEQFLQYFLRDQTRIFAYIRSLLPQYADAQDVFQRSSMTLWRNFDDFDEQRLFLPWACGIAFNEVRNFRRVSGRDRLHFSDDLIQQLAERRMATLGQRDRRSSAMRICVEHLKQTDRDLIRLAYEELRSVAEIAELTGKAVQTLYNRLSGVRRSLLQCIEKRIAAEEVSG
ncbi:RNA polymerase sigma factor [Novipirellula galeiformis]|uniref:RNA polymerase sigma factor n=1 Tax=Novipirellula galeiformis TaxID=2528004 RepID=A0A5C6CLC2_9BACT|nr:sigma-70 family RNA polymerase sigma factor [Novipirellula galeiformis]TWU24357.1 RNA polymerase sigma factor [Novipirellula galeiformis]